MIKPAILPMFYISVSGTIISSEAQIKVGNNLPLINPQTRSGFYSLSVSLMHLLLTALPTDSALVQGHACHHFLHELLQRLSRWFPPITAYASLHAKLIVSHISPRSPSVVLCGSQCEYVILQDQYLYFDFYSLWNLLQCRAEIVSH